MSWNNLKAAIDAAITTNDNQEITGAILNSTLKTIVDTIGTGATFIDVATPSTNPGTPDGPVFYIAIEAGTYSNFGNIGIQDGISLLVWNGSGWILKSLLVGSVEAIQDEIASIQSEIVDLKEEDIRITSIIDDIVEAIEEESHFKTSELVKSIPLTSFVQGDTNGLTKNSGLQKSIRDITDTGYKKMDLSEIMEFGNITINASGWNYSDSQTRLRTKANQWIYVKKNDYVTTDWTTTRLYIGMRDANGTYTYAGWVQSDYKFTKDCEVVLLFTDTPEGNVDKNAMLAKISLYTTSSLGTLSKMNATPTQPSDIVWKQGTYASGWEYRQSTTRCCTIFNLYEDYDVLALQSDGGHNFSVGFLNKWYTSGENPGSINEVVSGGYSIGAGYRICNIPAGTKAIILTAGLSQDAPITPETVTNLNIFKLSKRPNKLTFTNAPSANIDVPNGKIQFGDNTIIRLDFDNFSYYVNFNYQYNNEEARLAALTADIGTESKGSFFIVCYDYANINFVAKAWSYNVLEDTLIPVMGVALTGPSNDVNSEVVSVDFSGDYTISGVERWKFHSIDGDKIMKSINHQGWYQIPNQTLLAYKMSKTHGFNYVECDINFTSDNVPVLIHNATINGVARNTDGSQIEETIYVNQHTFAELNEYDYGIRFGQKFKGLKLASLEEFIALCKNIGLHPYIELKAVATGGYEIMYNIVKKYNMLRNVTWISFNLDMLQGIQAFDSKARLGYIIYDTLSQTQLNNAISLRNGENEVFIDSNHLSQSAVDMLIAADMPQELWTIDTKASLLSANPWVSGITTNKLLCGEILYYENTENKLNAY